MALTAFAVLAFCVPSYLSLEPNAAGEKVGFICILMAALGAAVGIISLTRAVSAICETVRYLHHCERHGREINVPGESTPVLSSAAALVAAAGVLILLWPGSLSTIHKALEYLLD